MSEEIIKVLDYLGEKFGIAIDWTQENILPYLQDLLSRFAAYRIVVNICWMLLCIGGLILGVYFGKKLIANFKAASNEGKDGLFFESWGDSVEPTLLGIFSVIGFILLILISFFVFLFSAEELIKWIFIPELPMIEYIKQLVETY